MKTFRFLMIAALLVVVAGSISSCKKDKDKRPDCRIITITPTTGDAINVSYNEDGKIAALTQGTYSTTYAHSGNNSVSTTTNSGTFSNKQITTFNANGLTTNKRTENNVSGTVWTNEAYEYSGTELIKSTRTSSSGGAPEVTIYTFSNGNLASATTGAGTPTTVEYFTDKSVQPGDYLLLTQLVQGIYIFKNRNLVKSVFSGSSITSFEYTFAADGSISAVKMTDGSTVMTYNLQYQCN